MLDLVAAQQERVSQAQLSPIPWLYAVWGVAWLVGFLVLWSSELAGIPWFTLPAALAAGVFVVLIGGAAVASVVMGMRVNRGVRGASSFGAAVYGLSWPLCGAAFFVLGAGLLRNGLSAELAALYFPSAFALMCGAVYLGGAALWRDTSQLVLGIALLAIGAAAPYFGSPANDLFLAVAAGGAFFAAAGATAAGRRRGR